MNEMLEKSHTLRLRVWGDNACFTRPEMKVERVSYDVITPSAARGILEAIHWKPAIRWKVEQIDVLKPIRWESVRRNEVGSVMSPRTEGFFIEDQRQQRASLLLRDVDYLIHAHFEMTGKAGADDNVIKHEQMFIRHAEKGQCYSQPYLGCREFAASFSFVAHNGQLPEPAEKTPELGFGAPRDLGFMLYDIDHDNNADENGAHFCNERCKPNFFHAVLDKGHLVVPILKVPKGYS